MIKLYSEKSQKTNIAKHKIKPNEVYYLRLVAHEFSCQQICDFLNSDVHMLSQSKRRIQKKLNCNTFTNAIIKAFELNILDKYDYVSPLIKNQALIYANTIFNILKDQTVYKNIEIKILQNIILEFNQKCKNVLQKKNKVLFSPKEKYYLKLKIISLQSNNIINELKLSSETEALLKAQILKKLQTEEWFNVLRKVFNYGILKREDYSSLNSSIEALVCASEILSLQSQSSFYNLSDKEKQLIIYFQLINFYNKLEYSCLSKSIINLIS